MYICVRICVYFYVYGYIYIFISVCTCVYMCRGYLRITNKQPWTNAFSGVDAPRREALPVMGGSARILKL